MPSQGIMQQLKKEFSHLVQIHNSTPAIDGLVAMAEAMFSAPVFLIIIYQKEGNHLIHHQGVDINKVKLNTMYLHDLDQQDGNALILQESEKLQPLNTHLGLSKVQFYAGCALRNTKGESIGRVELMDHNPRIFSEKDIHLLELLAKQLAHALITEVNLKLAQTYLLTIFSNAPVAMLVVRPDNGKIISCTSNSAVTITVPALNIGFNCLIVQRGTGQVTLSASGSTINNRYNFTKTAGQHAIMSIVSVASGIFVSSGDMSN